MKAKVAVATVQGKAYFLAVNELKQRNIPFYSLIPGEPISSEVKAVITTEQEKHLISHEKILAFSDETQLDEVMSEITKVILGKKNYEKIVIGIDPGEVFGLSAVADGKVFDKENCYSAREVVTKIKNVLKNVDLTATNVDIKIGNGVPAYKELIAALDIAVPSQVVLEVVDEFGTNGTSKENKRSRRLRHISSASRIAARSGYIYPRKKTVEAST